MGSLDMSHCDAIAKDIQKGWLSIPLTRLAIGCMAMLLFICFAGAPYLWFLHTTTELGGLAFPIVTPAQ